MMSSALAMRLGLPIHVATPGDAGRGDGAASGNSHGSSAPGRRRSDTVKPTRPAFGFAPRPVAPSSLISPPEPVAAPGNGEIAVGWLCVSTLPRMRAGSTGLRYTPSASGKNRSATEPSITAALSLYAESTPPGAFSVERLIH